MATFNEYLDGTTPIDTAALDELTERYPWFSAARALRDGKAAYADSISSAHLQTIDAHRLAEESEGEIIDRFLRLDDYRIVADEGADEKDVATEAELDEEDDLVSEDLAEIYIAQGLKNEAIEIYRKLSLRNTEKSIYFVRKIEELSNNN